MKSELIKVFFGENLSKALLLVVNLVLINCMSVSEYAQYTLLFTMTMLGAQLVCAAAERLYIADHQNFSAYSGQALVMCLVACILIMFFYLKSKASALELVIVCVALVLLSFYQFRRITYQQRQNFSLYLLAEILKNGCWLLAVAILYLAGQEVTAVFSILLLVVSAGIGFIVMPKADKADKAPLVNVKLKDVLGVVAKNADVYIYTLIAAVLPYLPVIMANHTGQEGVMATYGSAMRYQAILASFINVLNVVYLPKLAAHVGDGQGYVFLRKSYKAIPLMTIAAVAITVLVAYAIPYVDKGKYPDAPAVFMFFAGCSWLSLISVASINYLLAMQVYRPILITMALGLLLTLISYFVFSMYFPVLGIAMSSLAGYIVINGMLIWCARKLVGAEAGHSQEQQS